MRINRVPRNNDGPPNELFVHFGLLLNALLEPRRPTTPTTYVRMPPAESSVLVFTRAGEQHAVGLLVGHIGIGKSSLLNYLRTDVWKHEGCAVIWFNGVEHNFASQLGESFSDKTPKLQRQKASLVAVNAICAQIKDHIADELATHQMDLFVFIEKTARYLLPTAAILKRDLTKVSDYLLAIESTSPMDFWCCALVERAMAAKLKHVKFVVDNIDDKNEFLIAQFVEGLAHLQRCFNTIANAAGDKDIRLTPLVACRPTTQHRIHDLVDFTAGHTGQGWMGLRDIEIHQPCDLADALNARYKDDVEQLERGGEVLGDRYEFVYGKSDSAKTWVVKKERWFSLLIDCFQRSNQFGDILKLCNYDVAATLSMVLKVLINRHFLHITKIAAAIQRHSAIGAEWPEGLMTSTTALRAVAYGNQNGPYPVYPVVRTAIPNLLEGRAGSFTKSLLKLRVMVILVRSAESSVDGTSNHTSTADSRSLLTELLVVDGGATQEQLATVIDELFQVSTIAPREVIGTPSEITSNVALLAQPKAFILLQHLEDDTTLLECWRDFSELSDDLHWRGSLVMWSSTPSRGMDIENLAQEVFYMIAQARNVENAELKRYPVSVRREVWRRSGGSLTRRLLKGFKGSLGRHYSHEAKWKADALLNDVRELEDLLNSDEVDLLVKGQH